MKTSRPETAQAVENLIAIYAAASGAWLDRAHVLMGQGDAFAVAAAIKQFRAAENLRNRLERGLLYV